MTEVLSSSPGMALSTYTYTSMPRAIQLRTSRTRSSQDSQGQPVWNPYFANARSLSQERLSQALDSQMPVIKRAEFREKLEARARLQREKHGLSNLYSSNPSMLHRQSYRLAGSDHSEGGHQTDGRSRRRSHPNRQYRPPPGVDAQTQVYQEELEEAGGAALEEVVLGTLVSRALREAVLEVVLEEQAEDARLSRILMDATGGSYGGVPVEEEREEPEGKEISDDAAEVGAVGAGAEDETEADADEIKGEAEGEEAEADAEESEAEAEAEDSEAEAEAEESEAEAEAEESEAEADAEEAEAGSEAEEEANAESDAETKTEEGEAASDTERDQAKDEN